MAEAVCVNCRNLRKIRTRGLCGRCYSFPTVRAAFPPPPRSAAGREPTMAELDALVAEQMANLPDWWHKETGR